MAALASAAEPLPGPDPPAGVGSTQQPPVTVDVEPAVIIADTTDQTVAKNGQEKEEHKTNGSTTAVKCGDEGGNATAEAAKQPIGELHLTTANLSSSPPPISNLSPSTAESVATNSRARPTSIVPVFWQHTRKASRASVTSMPSPGITLTDNTEPSFSDSQFLSHSTSAYDHNSTFGSSSSPPLASSTLSPSRSNLGSPLWARQVDVDDYVKIEGDLPGVGGYIVWLVKVQTLDGGASIVLRKRYSEFEALRAQLAATFPRAGESLPSLPPKSVFYKFKASFLEKRRIGLAYFLNCILLNPEFSGTPAVRDFIFAVD